MPRSRPVRKRKAQEDLYEVEAIMAHRIKGGSTQMEYLVKWRGYHVSESTWEPLENNQCPDIIKDYFRILNTQEARRKNGVDNNAVPNIAASPAEDVLILTEDPVSPTRDVVTPIRTTNDKSPSSTPTQLMKTPEENTTPSKRAKSNTTEMATTPTKVTTSAQPEKLATPTKEA